MRGEAAARVHGVAVRARITPACTGSSPRASLAQPAERCVIHRDSNAIIATDKKGAVHIPSATVISCSDNLRVAGRASSAVGGALRIDIRRLTIPVLPLEQQQAYGDAFRRLAEFRTTLNHAAEIGAALAREISDALTTGALELSRRSAQHREGSRICCPDQPRQA